MNSEEKFFQELGKLVDAKLPSSDQRCRADEIVSSVKRRACRQSEMYFSSALLAVLLCVTFATWQWNKLDWQMSQTSWPGYSQYQQFNMVAHHDNR